jgi:hypothetical protein
MVFYPFSMLVVAKLMLAQSSVLDSLFCVIFFAFLSLRIPALISHDLVQSKLAFDSLALSACFLFPRLSITLIRENVILLALSALIKEFLFVSISSHQSTLIADISQQIVHDARRSHCEWCASILILSRSRYMGHCQIILANAKNLARLDVSWI